MYDVNIFVSYKDESMFMGRGKGGGVSKFKNMCKNEKRKTGKNRYRENAGGKNSKLILQYAKTNRMLFKDG